LTFLLLLVVERVAVAVRQVMVLVVVVLVASELLRVLLAEVAVLSLRKL